MVWLSLVWVMMRNKNKKNKGGKYDNSDER